MALFFWLRYDETKNFYDALKNFDNARNLLLCLE